MEYPWSTQPAFPSSTPCASRCESVSAPRWTFAAASRASLFAAAGPVWTKHCAAGCDPAGAPSSSGALAREASRWLRHGRPKRAVTGSPWSCSTRPARACRTRGWSRRTRKLRSGRCGCPAPRSGPPSTSRFARARSAWRSCSSHLRLPRGLECGWRGSRATGARGWCSHSHPTPGVPHGPQTIVSASMPGSFAGLTVRSARCRRRVVWR